MPQPPPAVTWAVAGLVAMVLPLALLRWVR
jgi:hypothetical protein